MDNLGTYGLIIIFSLTLIVSYFFNIYAKKSGIPSVLMLIALGIFLHYGLLLFDGSSVDFSRPLEVLGVVGLILILLEAALDLRLEKNKIGLIIKSFLMAFLGLGATAYLAAYCFTYFLDISLLNGLLFSIPLSILSSAIILPSIEDLDEDKREFMVYESTFSDIVGIIGFDCVLNMLDPAASGEIYGELFTKLVLTIVFSIVISYALICVFQKIKGQVKLFLLIAILLLLYAVGQIFDLSSLLIILIFGMILNNYKVFFKGWVMKLLNKEKVEVVLNDMKVVTAESAFVVRTFFFIIFGWSVCLGSLLSLEVVGLGLLVLVIIYLVRGLMLFVFNGTDINPQLFLAPRGLITILLFFAIPEELTPETDFQGVLLFVILFSCVIMTWAMMVRKKNLALLAEDEITLTTAEETENEKE